MKKSQFNKKYKEIKMYKYVPLLEKEIRRQINQKYDWMETAVELEDTKKEILKTTIPELSFIAICSILVAFNYFIIVRFA